MEYGNLALGHGQQKYQVTQECISYIIIAL